MMRKTANAPEWAKILFQELTRPPQFLVGIMEDQKNKPSQESATQAEQQPRNSHNHSQTFGKHTRQSKQSKQSKQSQQSKYSQQPAQSYTTWSNPSSANGHTQANTSSTGSRRMSQTKYDQQTPLSERAHHAKQSALRVQSGSNTQKSSKYAKSTEEKNDRDVVQAALQQEQASAKTSSNSSWRQVLQDTGIPPTVVKQYTWKVTKAKYAGTAVRVQTSNSSYALKESSIEAARIQFLQSALKYARQRGFIRGPRFAFSKQKRPYVIQDNQTYYATRWIEGRAVHFTNNTDVGRVARTLAEFHEATRGFENTSYNPPMEFGLEQMTKRRFEDLKMMLAEADGRSSQGTFDKLLLSIENQIRKDAEESLDLLNDSDIQDFLLHDEYQAGLCHLDVIPGNFTYDKSDTVHLLDLDLCTYAPRVLDIAHLLRRSLQLQEWDHEVAYVSFLNFDKVASISREEYLLIQALLTFPYKVWRLTHTRFRLFPEAAQVDELKKYIRQEEKRHQFLEELSSQISK